MLRQNAFFYTLFLLLMTTVHAYAEDEVSEESAEPSEGQSSQQVDVPERVGGLNEEQLRQLAMATEAKEREVVWLEVTYPEMEDVHQVLALEQKPRAPKSQSQGAVLILHDKEQHADWPFLIRSLRMALPDSGWYTLSVNLPYDEVRNIPQRVLEAKKMDQIVMTDGLRSKLRQASSQTSMSEEGQTEAEEGSAEQEASPENEQDEGEEEVSSVDDAGGEENEQDESVDIDLAEKEKPKLPYRDRALEHVKAAMEHINQKGYRNIIVIGYRAGADIMLEYIKPLASSIGKQGFGLVMIDPRLQLGYQSDLSSALGENFRAPILDIVNGSDLDSRVDAAEREAGARIASALLYRQIRLTANESGAFQQTLIRRVRAWMEKYAPGMQATKLDPRN